MTGRAGDALIQLTAVGKCYDDRWVLRDIHLDVPRRGILGIVGPSGVGKTTLARLIMRLEVPDAGRVTWDGDVRLAALFPQDRLLPTQNVGQNFRYTGLVEQSTLPALTTLGLAGTLGQRPDTLSTGMSRRIAFTRAYCHPADLLVLDEPFKGLDEDARNTVAAMIVRTGQDRAVLLIDHNLALVDSIAQAVVQLRSE